MTALDMLADLNVGTIVAVVLVVAAVIGLVAMLRESKRASTTFDAACSALEEDLDEEHRALCEREGRP